MIMVKNLINNWPNFVLGINNYVKKLILFEKDMIKLVIIIWANL